MTMQKLAIVSAIAMMGMGSVYAQQTTVTTTNEPTTAETAGLMTTLSDSVGALFNAGSNSIVTPTLAAVAGAPGVYEAYTGTGAQLGQPAYILRVGESAPVLANALEIEANSGLLYQKTAPVAGVAALVGNTTYNAINPVDITALAGAVNLAAINGGINITGTNVSLSGLANIGATATTGLSTTVIGAMNSSTLDIAKMTVNLSDKTAATLNIDGLANQGAAPSITSQGFGPGQLQLATMGTKILDAAEGTTQFDMHGLTSSTDTLSTSMTDKLQNMNVFNMAVNMAPLVAGVNIAAAVDPNAWFLNPQTGVVNLTGLSVATTAIGAMNSSLTSLGAKLR